MSEILTFPDTRENLVRRNKETSYNQLDEEIEDLIIQTPQRIEEIINEGYIQGRKIIVINSQELKLLIIDYIIFKLQESKVRIEGSILFAIEYLADLLYKIFLYQGDDIKLIVQEPYFTHWMERGFPKRAGDASVYSYIFRDFGVKSPIQKDDYLDFIKSGYLEYSKDPYFAEASSETTSKIGGLLHDENFLKRGNLREINI